VDPAQQLVYYQGQSVQILAQISQQIASSGTQIPLNVTQPLPYPTFHPSASDRRVNIFWLMSLVFSLSASLLATVVQQWARSYLRVYHGSKKPLKTARVQTFLSEGLERMPMMAEAAPGLVHVSVFLFFVGLGDAVLNINTTIGVATIVPIIICGFVYLYSTVTSLTDPRSSYRSPFSRLMSYILRNRFHRAFKKMEERQEKHAMNPTKGREDRDVRAVQWLIDNIDRSNEMETFVMAIPGSFNEGYGQQVWKEVIIQGEFQPNVREAQLTLPADVHVPPRLDPSSPSGGSTVDDLCRCVRYLFETYNTDGNTTSIEAQRRRMHGCTEAAASLVCYTGVQLGRFGEVGQVIGELGRIEKIDDASTIKANPSFAIRWTCLSLVAIRQMMMDKHNRVWELAGFAVSGIARFQLVYGAPDEAALRGAQRIDDYLTTSWTHVEDLYRAFEPWGLNKTREEIMDTLNGLELPISELERIEIETDGIEDVDWRISLLQDAMSDATHQVTRLLLGESSNELKQSGPIPIADAFHSHLPGSTPITPLPFIFPGQHLQGIFTLRRGLRDILENQNPEEHSEIVEVLESIDNIPVPLRRLKGLMARQLWRLQDLRDGGGLGFTIELFFLALRRLSSASSSPELKRDLYTGTFNVITSGWEESRDSSGTQRVLLNLLCDLIIQGRGIFSDFSYPEYIVEMLLELVGNIVESDKMDAALEELWNVDSRDCRDRGLWNKVLQKLRSF